MTGLEPPQIVDPAYPAWWTNESAVGGVPYGQSVYATRADREPDAADAPYDGRCDDTVATLPYGYVDDADADAREALMGRRARAVAALPMALYLLAQIGSVSAVWRDDVERLFAYINTGRRDEA